MRTITFSEAPFGTINPRFIYANNTISVTGQITSDGAQPTSPVVSGTPRFLGHVEVSLANAVKRVSLDVGYLDTLGSVTLTFRGADGRLLDSVTTSQTGIQNINYTNVEGIGSLLVRITNPEPAGFSVDNFSFSRAIDEPLRAPKLNALSGEDAINVGEISTSGFFVDRLTDFIDPAEVYLFTSVVSGTVIWTATLTEDRALSRTFVQNVDIGNNYLTVM